MDNPESTHIDALKIIIRELLKNYLISKNKIIKQYTGITYVDYNDLYYIHTWTFNELLKIIKYMLKQPRSDASICPWCALYFSNENQCSSCGYGKKYGNCRDIGSKYRNILFGLSSSIPCIHKIPEIIKLNEDTNEIFVSVLNSLKINIVNPTTQKHGNLHEIEEIPSEIYINISHVSIYPPTSTTNNLTSINNILDIVESGFIKLHIRQKYGNIRDHNDIIGISQGLGKLINNETLYIFKSLKDSNSTLIMSRLCQIFAHSVLVKISKTIRNDILSKIAKSGHFYCNGELFELREPPWTALQMAFTNTDSFILIDDILYTIIHKQSNDI